jgi:hypothetical protein
MRDFYFFTNKPITAKDCYEKLKKEIKYLEMNGETDIWINHTKFRSFLWLNNEGIKDYWYCTEEEFKELKKQIPINEPYINHFETHRSIDAKRFIKVLMEIYPELYIDIDDDTAWQGTAQEYLDTEFYY